MAKRLSDHIHLKNTIMLISIVAVLLLAYFNFSNIKTGVEYIIKHYESIVFITITAFGGIGITHALTKRTNENNVFFLKFLGSPFLAAVFTAVTYGIVINGCLTLLYMLLYDSALMEKYPTIERYATSLATILLFVASILGICKMIWEICSPPENKVITSRKQNNKAK